MAARARACYALRMSPASLELPYSFNRVLAYAAVAHALVGLVCAVWLLFDARPILGVHPALKPLKFAGSIAAFLATLALVLAMLELKAWQAGALAWVLTLTMIGEMGPIAWQAMFFSIIAATLAMMVLALVASLRPMTLHEAAGPGQRPLGAHAAG